MQVIENFLDHLRLLAAGGGFEMRQEGQFHLFKSGIPHPMANWVIGLGTPEDPGALLPDELPFMWLSDPRTETLDAKLHGLGLAEDRMVGVTLQLDGVEEIEEDSRITTTNDLTLWSQVASEVWHGPPSWFEKLYQGYANGPEGAHLFLAWDADEPVGAAMLHCERGMAGFHWNAVKPEHRGKGLGSALVGQGLRLARQHGCGVALAACRHTSIGIFRRLGFQDTGSLASYLPAQFTENVSTL